MAQKKRRWTTKEDSKIWESFIYTDEIKCPNGKKNLELSYDVSDYPSDTVTFTFSCLRCARETNRKFPELVEERYVKLSNIGRGSMGEVYVGRHLRLARRVAIKEITTDFLKREEEDFPFRFEREIRICSSLNHPNIIKIFDRNVKEDQDNPLYFVMEYAEAGDLDRWLKARHKLPAKLRKFSQICHAIAFAHSRKVVHRDIKPANILMNDKNEPKVADFGLAKFIKRERLLLTSPSNLIGSFPYMAPEQYENPQKVDYRADIYSLGVLFYHMLTNRLPFINPPKIAMLTPELRGHPDELFLKMTEFDVEERYQSLAEFRKDFDVFLEKQSFRGV